MTEIRNNEIEMPTNEFFMRFYQSILEIYKTAQTKYLNQMKDSLDIEIEGHKKKK